MTELVLAGCRTAPLGRYLTAVGVLRLVSRQLDPGALGHWADRRFVLRSRFGTVQELVDELSSRFEPEAIVSPWNAGSGFARNGKNTTAEGLLQQVRDSSDGRLRNLAAAVAAGDEVVRVGRSKGWGGSGDEMWDRSRKSEVLRLCRNTFPDAALPWVDAAVALGTEAEPTYSRLLGTGGNFGRQDLSVTYLSRALSVLADRRGPQWLRSALTGDETVPHLRDAVGQFDPGKSGGIQSSPWEKADDKGFVNPWSFLLTIEGALLFAGATVRRLGAQHARPALPFQVHGSSGGFATTAPGETALGEIWTPEWSDPVGLGWLTHLLAEGRAEWRDSPARSGLDFARAVAALGVDRGIDAFTRHVFVDRLGQSPLAVPAGRVTTQRRAAVGLLAELDSWLARLGGATVPAAVAAGSRLVEQRLFDLAVDERGLVTLFGALGRLVEAVNRSGAARELVHPLVLRRGRELYTVLCSRADDDLELRVALALATAQDAEPGRTLRPYLHPVEPSGSDPRWAWTYSAAPAPLTGGVGRALAEVARRRSFPGATTEHVATDVPAVRGARFTFARGALLATGDRETFARGALDLQRLADLLSGLLCVAWQGSDRQSLPEAEHVPDPAIDVLLPFTSASAEPMLVRPARSWAALLAAGRVHEVLTDAAHRLRVAGCRFVVAPGASSLDGPLLAASLLLPSSPHQRTAALDRTAVRTDLEVAT